MSKKVENTLQKKCIDYLKEKNIYYINKYGDGRSGLGTPDLITCINGRFVAFELKVGDNDMSKAQKIRKKQIEASGGRHYAPYTIDEFIECVKKEVTNEK